jgi:hypothetical protein
VSECVLLTQIKREIKLTQNPKALLMAADIKLPIMRGNNMMQRAQHAAMQQ